MDWSTNDAVAVVKFLGFSPARQEAHDTFTRPGHPRTVSIPRNRKSLGRETLKTIWRQAGITGAEARRIRTEELK